MYDCSGGTNGLLLTCNDGVSNLAFPHAVSVADTNRRHLRRLSQLTKEETLTRALERTADTSGSRGLTQRREHTTMEQRTNTLLGTHQRITNTTGDGRDAGQATV